MGGEWSKKDARCAPGALILPPPRRRSRWRSARGALHLSHGARSMSPDCNASQRLVDAVTWGMPPAAVGGWFCVESLPFGVSMPFALKGVAREARKAVLFGVNSLGHLVSEGG